MADGLVQGTCDPRVEAVREALEANLASGEELGASVHVDLDGEPLVDLWGGSRDVERTVPWTEDTITNVWSTTKTVTNLAALVLVERGQLDVDAPVAQYWPEFAAARQAGHRVRHLMAHTSGVSGWDPPFTVEDIYDWEARDLAARRPGAVVGARDGVGLPRQQPGAPGRRGRAPGRRAAAQAVRRRGARRAARRRLPRSAPRSRTGAASPTSSRRRRSPFDLAALPPDSPAVKHVHRRRPPTPAGQHPRLAARRHRRAINGHGNARSVARMQSVVSRGGEVDGVRLLSPATIDLIFASRRAAWTWCWACRPLRHRLGAARPRTGAVRPRRQICFWGGWGGSMIIIDIDRRMTIAYMMNKMAPGILGSARSEAYVRAAYEALGVQTAPTSPVHA